MTKIQDSIVTFNCGHSYHINCINENVFCMICSMSKNSQKQKGKKKLEENQVKSDSDQQIMALSHLSEVLNPKPAVISYLFFFFFFQKIKYNLFFLSFFFKIKISKIIE